MLKVLDLKFIEYEAEREIEISKALEFISYQVSHGEMDAYALRFLLGNKIVSYSGDSGVCEGIRKASLNSEIFLCEAAININDNENNTKAHLSYFLAGEIAKKSNVGKLVLVHHSGKDSDEIMVQEVKKSGFSGDIEIAKDLDTFAI